MLQTVSIPCPMCDRITEIGVSQQRGSGFATTHCRHCVHPFIAFTEKDGRVILIDGKQNEEEQPRVLAILQPPSTKSGYRVEPPEHLGIFTRGYPPPAPQPGLSDEDFGSGSIVQFGQVLRKEDGTPRDPAAAAKVVGWRTVWVEQLREALQRRYAGPPPLSFPPRIFISYRWATPSENQWTAALAANLKARGYPVTFDRDEPKDVNVPEIVSKIADCRYFIAVIDAGYIERLGRAGGGGGGTYDGWVFDEVQTAIGLENSGWLRIIGFLRSGSALPMNFRHAFQGEPGNTVDVRTPNQLAAVLDDLFPPIDHGPDEETVERARTLLHESHEHLCAQRFAEAYQAAQELTTLLPGVIDGPAQKVRVAYHAGASDEGLRAAEEALVLAPHSRELLIAAGSFANDARQYQRAAVHLALFLEAHGGSDDPDVAAAHLGLGSALDDLDQLHPALAHLEIARSMQPANSNVLGTLGFVYLRAGDSKSAVDRLEEGVEHDPESILVLENLIIAYLHEGRVADARTTVARLAAIAPGHPRLAGLQALAAEGRPPRMRSPAAVTPRRRVQCSACAARVPLADEKDLLCGRCGSVVAAAERLCPSCTSDGRVVLIPGIPFRCPYCRKGQVSAL